MNRGEKNAKIFFRMVLVLFCVFLPISASLSADLSTSHFIFLRDGIGELQKPEKQVASDDWNEWLAQDGDYHLSTNWVSTMKDFLRLVKKQEIDYALLDGSNIILS